MTEDEMVGWHHPLYGHEFEQALRDDEGQGSLVCCSSWHDHMVIETLADGNKRVGIRLALPYLQKKLMF